MEIKYATMFKSTNNNLLQGNQKCISLLSVNNLAIVRISNQV